MIGIRRHTGAILGIVGNSYKVVPHSEVIKTFEAVPKLSLKNVNACRNDAIMFVTLDFVSDHDKKDARVKD